MSKDYNKALCERLDTEALAAFDELPVPQDSAANRLHLAARGKLCTMADQLQAAVIEVDRLAKLSASQSRLLSDNAASYHAIRCAHEAEVEALSATRRELDAWKQMYDSAEKSFGELSEEREAMRAEVERLRATASRFATAFALLAKIRAEGTWISSVNPERQTIERHIDKVLGMINASPTDKP